MPRIVYGVIDIHRSHRIEVPRPSDATRPDACNLCHVAGVAGRASPPIDAVFTADPVGRAVAADALGRAPVLSADQRARRMGALLADMESDAYPAVRRIAWRSARRLLAPGAAPGTGLAADFDPSGDVAERAAVVAGLRRALGPAAGAADPRAVAALARATPGEALEIGE